MDYYSVTHEPLPWPLPTFMQPVSTVPAGPQVRDLGIDHPDLAGRGAQLGEYATLFALARELAGQGEDAPENELIGVSHYRRFAVAAPVGEPTSFFAVTTSEAFGSLDESVFLPPPGVLLVPSPAGFPHGVLAGYAANHVARDLLHFFGIAVDLEVVPDQVTAAFLDSRLMLATPSVAVVPRSWFIRTMTELQAVAAAFEESAAVLRTGYQRRAVGFCVERLHAMLLALLVHELPAAEVRQCPSLVVSATGSYAVGG